MSLICPTSRPEHPATSPGRIMKHPICRSLVVAIQFLMAFNECNGQSTFVLRNRYTPVSLDAPIFDASGAPLFGDEYRAELWGGPTPESLSPAHIVGGTDRHLAIFHRRGYFRDTLGLPASIDSVGPGGFAWLQVRVWDTTVGATYEEAFAKAIGGYGQSELLYLKGGNPSSLQTPSELVGLKSFSILPVIPEPSTVALIAVGGGMLAAFGLRPNASGHRRSE